MCKLCNSFEPAVTLATYNTKSSKVLEFLNVAKQYTGEYPCKNCIQKLYQRQSLGRDKTYNVDQFCQNRIQYSYLSKQKINFTKSILKMNLETFKATHGTKASYKTDGQIEQNITVLISLRTGAKSYRFYGTVFGKRIIKICSTLQEAQQMKANYLNEYGNPNARRCNLNFIKNKES
jgi:hypothetical protein